VSRRADINKIQQENKTRITHEWCIMLRYSQNLSQDLRSSSTAQKTATKICVGASDRPNRNRRSNSTLLIRSRCSANLLLVKILQILLVVTKYRACGTLKVIVKEKGKSQLRYHRKRCHDKKTTKTALSFSAGCLRNLLPSFAPISLQ